MCRAKRTLAVLLGVTYLMVAVPVPAQQNPGGGYPDTYLGCLAAAADQLIECVDFDTYPDWMCVDTYDIVVALCRIQYPE